MTYLQEWKQRLAALPPIAQGDPTVHPAMTLEVEGVIIHVRFDRWDADQPQYLWTISTVGSGISDTGTMRGEGGTPIALDSAITQILEAMRDATDDKRVADNFPNLLTASVDIAYVANMAAHYLPSAP